MSEHSCTDEDRDTAQSWHGAGAQTLTRTPCPSVHQQVSHNSTLPAGCTGGTLTRMQVFVAPACGPNAERQTCTGPRPCSTPKPPGEEAWTPAAPCSAPQTARRCRPHDPALPRNAVSPSSTRPSPPPGHVGAVERFCWWGQAGYRAVRQRSRHSALARQLRCGNAASQHTPPPFLKRGRPWRARLQRRR